jgi:hypothetical protein
MIKRRSDAAGRRPDSRYVNERRYETRHKVPSRELWLHDYSMSAAADALYM